MSKYIKHGNHYGEDEEGNILNTLHFSYIWLDLAIGKLPPIYWKYCNKFTSRGLIIHNSQTPLGRIGRNGYLFNQDGKVLYNQVRRRYYECDYDWLAVDTSNEVEDKIYILTKSELLFIGQELKVYYDGAAIRRLITNIHQ